MIKRIACFFWALVLCLGICPMECGAAQIEADRACSLTVSYGAEGKAFSELEINIFRVAELGADGEYHLLKPYADYPIRIHGITSQQEWQETAQTIRNYVTANQLAPYRSQKTNDAGEAVFTGLETGLYMVQGTTAQYQNTRVVFQDFMIYLPTPSAGEYDYDMEAKPKHTEYVQPEKYTVMKLWKDSGSSGQRPKEIRVDILKDGSVQQSVTLSAANNWAYSWEVTDPDGVWSVIERDVPDGYQVSIVNQQTTFVITNLKEPEPSDPSSDAVPTTGDTMPLKRYITIMCISGFALILLGILRQKEKNYEKK